MIQSYSQNLGFAIPVWENTMSNLAFPWNLYGLEPLPKFRVCDPCTGEQHEKLCLFMNSSMARSHYHNFGYAIPVWEHTMKNLAFR